MQIYHYLFMLSYLTFYVYPSKLDLKLNLVKGVGDIFEKIKMFEDKKF